jgi:alpha-N-arabinofuranosidase
MDKYDPEKKIGLVVDEWGAWHAEEPGTKSGFLYQQNTLRDAFVAALSLNIFHQHAERVRIANIAQTINVLQAMILTQNEKMILTPTYHVFDMYQVHQDALLLPHDLKSEAYVLGKDKLDALYASSSLAQDGTINIGIVNVHATKSMEVECELRGARAKKITGRILTASAINAHNTFDKPNNVTTAEFNGVTMSNGMLRIKMPAKSIVVVRVERE